ncbi:hypothetical protein QBC43DRAFT_250311 [Cladorrhinum sp. PSN259]|nr:hypothetical protein QBC43DRAFT_250311 [Cladorrhinum sp. PSN259]
MSELYGKTGAGVGAGLIGVTMIPVVVTWMVSLQKVVIAPNSKQIKIAHILVKYALSVFALGIILAVVTRAMRATGADRDSSSAYRATYYVWLTTVFVFYVASLLTAMALYIATYGVLYLALRRWKWWTMIQLDASIGGGIVAILIVALWAKNMADLAQLSDRSLVRYGFDFSLDWLALMVNGILTFVALGAGGVAIYAVSKLSKPDRSHLLDRFGQARAVLIAASFLWLLRCVYCVAVGIKSVQADWTVAALGAQNVVVPIFELWTMAAVLALLVYIIRRPIWSDPEAIPNLPQQQQLPVPPQMYQQPPVYQQGQQPVVYQTQPFPQQPAQQPVPMQQVPVQQQPYQQPTQ